MNKKIKYIFTVFIALFACREVLSSPVRIMPMGDSITYGDGSITTNSYRGTLKTLLDMGGHTNINFVGSTNSGNFADTEHEGWQGYRMAGSPKSLLEKAYDWGMKNPADIVLLNAGINDFLQNDPPDSNAVSQVIDEIYRANSNATIVLSLIPNGVRIHNFDTLTPFNNSVKSMAMNRAANGDDIIIVNMEAGAGIDYGWFSPDFLLTNPYVHPSDVGYNKMATNWYPSVVQALKHQSGVPYFYSNPDTNAVIPHLYTYEVGANGNPAPSYALETAPSGMTINATNGLVQWSPVSGTNAVSVLASNALGVVTQSFNIVAVSSTLPVITSDAVTNVVAEQLYSYDAAATGIPSASFMLDLAPSNMTVNAT
ncbi:GDSL-type esterase/lipase family protein, partial [Pontiellaceae bacterium B12227]|nr:GDSL-type esterase/lipase family protein [Pontiellaceae bacterium B12227]